MSQITTHILDTSIGKPAANVAVLLRQKSGDDWKTIAQDTTNADGRLPDLLPDETILPAGEYKLTFETEHYFISRKIIAFYPSVEIRFYVRDDAHYHIPLLLSPFGYMTYRGS